MTPREFHALLRRRQARDRLEDARAAIMPALYANAHRGKGPERKLEEFMPTEWARARRPMSGAEIIARFRELSRGKTE